MSRTIRIPVDRRGFLYRSAASISALTALASTESTAGENQAPSASALNGLVVHSEVPPNAEPPLKQLVQSWLTPTEMFYVRSHAPSPIIDAETFELSIEGLVRRPFRVKLRQLRHEFTNHSVVATLTCAGNRREEHSRVKTVSGVPWGAGAIGNARWRGVPLADLLRMAGPTSEADHVWFVGADQIERDSGVIPFGGSIPLQKVMSDRSTMPGALIVHEMNGEPLTRDHGFPIRSIVPGYIGARSVKWLSKIIVSDRPSENHYMATAYKLVTEGTPEEWNQSEPIGIFPVNSVTCIPQSNAQLRAGTVKLRGYALATGRRGRTIRKVEVSADGGRQWTPATFSEPARPFCWRLWSAEVRLQAGPQQVVVRATDSSGDVQPQNVSWNLKGYLFNAWHRTDVEVEG